jgi:hypothetical protein
MAHRSQGDIAKAFYKQVPGADTTKWTCLLCVKDGVEDPVQTTTSTSKFNLVRHTSRKHKEVWAQALSGKLELPAVGGGPVQSTLQRFNRPCGLARSEAIKDSYVDLVVADLNPISVVDGIAFKKLMKDAEPLFKGYTRQALTKRIIKKYQDEFAKVKANVQSDQENGSGPVSITTDIWSSKRAEDAVDVCTGSSTPSLTHIKHVHLVTSAPGTCL